MRPTSATQLDRSIQSIAALARQGDEVTRRVSRDAEDGGATIQRSIQGIGRLRESMLQSSSVMKQMGKRANEIGGIVDTINLIAERTNLLSLNASIEAARAGDAGRGFAVVAEEIRNLADRSAKATADIAAIIKALQEVAQDAVTATAEGMRVADESNALAEAGAGGLKKILSGLGEITGVVSQIAVARKSSRGRPGSRRRLRRPRPNRRGWSQPRRRNRRRRRPASRRRRRRCARSLRRSRRRSDSRAGAARDILKAAQSGSRLAAHVHKAAAEQARSAAEIVSATESMRRGAASSTRALAEQATRVGAAGQSGRRRSRR